MQTFHCDHCGQLVFFENHTCVRCRRSLAFVPETLKITAIETADANARFNVSVGGVDTEYRLCANYVGAGICNWAHTTDAGTDLCRSCQFTAIVPDLSYEGHRQAWFDLEVAKRRLLYTLMELGIAPAPRSVDTQQGLCFKFLASSPGAPVTTGHASGVITIDLAEARDATREKRRVELGEPYRTLLGHFRHEVGHFYWDRFIRDGGWLEACRQVFGDDRQDYRQALQRHYRLAEANPPDIHYISHYASSHPWEDWAETWAHYLHMVDTVGTAASAGMSMRGSARDDPMFRPRADLQGGGSPDFQQLIDSWFPVTYLLNNLNRGMGTPDAYPFVLTNPVIDKLRFVHKVVAMAATQSDAHGSGLR